MVFAIFSFNFRWVIIFIYLKEEEIYKGSVQVNHLVVFF